MSSSIVAKLTSRFGPPGADFGSRLAAYRKARGVTQKALAQQVGLDPTHLNKIESGARNPPAVDTVVAMARRLHLSPPEAEELVRAAGFAPAVLNPTVVWSPSGPTPAAAPAVAPTAPSAASPALDDTAVVIAEPSSGAPVLARLTVLDGPQAGAVFEIRHPTVLVGRGAGENHIAFPADEYPQISRAHAEISVDGGRIVVRDRGSTNHTRLEAPDDPPGAAARRIGAEPVEVPAGATLLLADVRCRVTPAEAGAAP
jgi:DNA-binding XRE family transcriptional regulator